VFAIHICLSAPTGRAGIEGLQRHFTVQEPDRAIQGVDAIHGDALDQCGLFRGNSRQQHAARAKRARESGHREGAAHQAGRPETRERVVSRLTNERWCILILEKRSVSSVVTRFQRQGLAHIAEFERSIRDSRHDPNALS
jgi:hypothetical protein